MKLSPELFMALAQSLGWTLLHSLWQGALVGCALLWVLRLLARRNASLRHAACMLALVTLALLAVFTTIRGLPSTRGNPPASISFQSNGAAFGAAGSVALSTNLTETPAYSTIGTPQRHWQEAVEALMPSIAAIWFFGIVLLSTRRIFAWRTLHGWKTRGLAARAGLQEQFSRLLQRFGVPGGVYLLESAEVAAPLLAGIFRPVVLLPLRVLTGLGEREIEAILAHELAHFVRHDAWFNLAQIALETLFFYHPVVWWMGRRAREEREHAADDLALELCDDRLVYAGALGHLAELSVASTYAVAANGGNLLARIRRILKPAEVEMMPGGWSAWMPMFISILGIFLLVHVQAQNTTTPSTQELVIKAYNDAKLWVADAFQLDDAAKRQAAVERIRQGMSSGNVDEARAAITAFTQIAPVEFDKVSFRPAVRALLNSPDIATRATAPNALVITGAEPEDLERVLAMVDDPAPEVRSDLSGVIMRLHNGDLTGRGGEAVVKLLAGQQAREALRGIWGARFSPALEARVIELSRTLENARGTGYDAMYYALSTQANKGEASVRRLIELLAHPDITNVAGRSAWGLQQGVAREQFGLIANAMVKLLEARSEGSLRDDAMRNLARYGSAEQAPALRALLAKPGVTGPFRLELEKTLAGLERSPAAAVPSPGKIDAATVPEKVAELEKKVATIEAEKSKEAQFAEMVAKNRQAARRRAEADRQRYNPEQLKEIETLYQVANTKGKRSEEARESLKQLLERYDGANRTGCALLYLGQASEGEKRLEYLTRAVEKFSDCYYFNGCQVGGYGRYVLALTLWEKGEKDKARQLFGEIKTTYKEATDHRGRPMPELVEEAEKELAKQP
ncbi:MAG: hypothetical protein JWL59_3353 [Chthoniobacteraceae bacterium]|nr:hypothetical protein [Chthoniobacteraceae bacterium]